jgi:ABC-type dipeptide/oligopeptide/nickel transport system permease subunit
MQSRHFLSGLTALAHVAFIQANAWLSLFPGLVIFVAVLGFNFFGDGLRDALDPRRM